MAAIWGMGYRVVRMEARGQACVLKIKTELATTKTVWLGGEKRLADPPSDGVLCVILLKLHEFRFRLSSAFELCPTGWNGYNFPTPEKHTPLFFS